MNLHVSLVSYNSYWVWNDDDSQDMLMLSTFELYLLRLFTKVAIFEIDADFFQTFNYDRRGAFYKGVMIFSGAFRLITVSCFIKYNGYQIVKLSDVDEGALLLVLDVDSNIVGSYSRHHQGVSTPELARLFLMLGDAVLQPLLA